MLLIDLAKPSRFLGLSGRLLPWLAAATLAAFAIGISQVIGTPDDYLQTSLLLSQREGTGAAHGAGTRVDATARVEDSVLWDDVEVGPGSMLKQCIVTDGARVPAETSWIGVTLRRADTQLAPGERRIGDLAIASI